jgi:hypothetical protein
LKEVPEDGEEDEVIEQYILPDNIEYNRAELIIKENEQTIINHEIKLKSIKKENRDRIGTFTYI